MPATYPPIPSAHAIDDPVRTMAQRYEALVNSLDAGFCVVEVIFDEEGRPADYLFLETNPGFEAATGLISAVGRRMRGLAPAHEQFWFDAYARVALSGVPARFEHQARALGRWYSVHAFRVGRPEQRHVAILFDDVTARKRAEWRRAFLTGLSEHLANLRDEDAITRTTVTAVGEALGAHRCAFVECLESENRVRFSQDFVRGTTLHLPRELSLFAFGGLEWWRTATRGNFAVEDVATHELTRGQAAAYLALEVRSYAVQPFKGEGPWTIGLAVTDHVARTWTDEEKKLIEDVAARVWPMIERARGDRALLDAHDELERRVAERTATLQDTISELESFSYSISHDLRAPLRAMQTYASILVDEFRELLPNEGKEYLRRIRVAADRMDRLIRDVLVFSRVARAETPAERIELGSFISSVIESYPELRDARAEIELVNPLPAVHVNSAALTQCISNLLGNALKFTTPDVPPKIRLWAEARGTAVRLFVRDNGIGISSELQDKIFGMFYQVDPRSEGTGIGLAVVRKAVERMGGAVGVTSEPGHGSTFWLELPAAIGA